MPLHHRGRRRVGWATGRPRQGVVAVRVAALGLVGAVGPPCHPANIAAVGEPELLPVVVGSDGHRTRTHVIFIRPFGGIAQRFRQQPPHGIVGVCPDGHLP